MGMSAGIVRKLLLCGLCFGSGVVVLAEDVSLPRSSPEAQGVSSQASAGVCAGG
jgi:hypothetical protein